MKYTYIILILFSHILTCSSSEKTPMQDFETIFRRARAEPDLDKRIQMFLSLKNHEYCNFPGIRANLLAEIEKQEARRVRLSLDRDSRK